MNEQFPAPPREDSPHIACLRYVKHPGPVPLRILAGTGPLQMSFCAFLPSYRHLDSSRRRAWSDEKADGFVEPMHTPATMCGPARCRPVAPCKASEHQARGKLTSEPRLAPPAPTSQSTAARIRTWSEAGSLSASTRADKRLASNVPAAAQLRTLYCAATSAMPQRIAYLTVLADADKTTMLGLNKHRRNRGGLFVFDEDFAVRGGPGIESLVSCRHARAFANLGEHLQVAFLQL
jgi:hypothetical protein